MALGGALGPAWAPVTPRHFVSRGRRGRHNNGVMVFLHANYAGRLAVDPYARHDYQPQGMQKEFAKFAASPERVQNITLVSGSMESTPSL